jgi:hypothetical protein
MVYKQSARPGRRLARCRPSGAKRPATRPWPGCLQYDEEPIAILDDTSPRQEIVEIDGKQVYPPPKPKRS